MMKSAPVIVTGVALAPALMNPITPAPAIGAALDSLITSRSPEARPRLPGFPILPALDEEAFRN